MKINITCEDIHLGVHHSSRQCPAARALRREFPDAFDIRVLRVQTLIYTVFGILAAPTTPALRAWIYEFDADKIVLPASFDLEFAKCS